MAILYHLNFSDITHYYITNLHSTIVYYKFRKTTFNNDFKGCEIMCIAWLQYYRTVPLTHIISY